MKKAQLATIRAKVVTAYTTELAALTGPGAGLKKKQVADLVAGFTDGWMNCIRALVADGALTLED